MRELYEAIAQDERHQNVRTLDARTVGERRFPDWSMKYVPLEKELNQVLQRHGQSQFDPYQFDVSMIEDMIELLVGSGAPDQEPDRARSAKRGPLASLKRCLAGA